LNNKVYLKKFDVKAQNGIFFGYSERSKAYIEYNSKTNTLEESININFDDKKTDNKMSELVESIAEIHTTKDASEPGS